ncbi:DUF6053 domain-containing protein [Lysobacter enzymogenes]
MFRGPARCFGGRRVVVGGPAVVGGPSGPMLSFQIAAN